MNKLYQYLKQLDAEQQSIVYLVTGARIVFNCSTEQDELEIENLDRLNWLGIIG